MHAKCFMAALIGICVGALGVIAYRWKGQEYGHWQSYKRRLR